uniref:Uncharacterized protein n=1 Tax=Arundo donax TaxID=35708 RepID=A0A0A9HTK5_ARUDO
MTKQVQTTEQALQPMLHVITFCSRRSRHLWAIIEFGKFSAS